LISLYGGLVVVLRVSKASYAHRAGKRGADHSEESNGDGSATHVWQSARAQDDDGVQMLGERTDDFGMYEEREEEYE
jgi:hypothetical protein